MSDGVHGIEEPGGDRGVQDGSAPPSTAKMQTRRGRKRKATRSIGEASHEDYDKKHSKKTGRVRRKKKKESDPVQERGEAPSSQKPKINGKKKRVARVAGESVSRKAPQVESVSDFTSYLELMNGVSRNHTVSVRAIDFYSQQFGFWKQEILSGFNVLLTGFGSKYDVLSKFTREICKDISVLEIKGFIPSLTHGKVMNAITRSVLKKQNKFSKGSVQFNAIRKHFGIQSKFNSEGESSTHLLIVVHSIDSLFLRLRKFQELFSSLACLNRVGIIASVDNVNHELMWSAELRQNFSWISHDVTTYCGFFIERSFYNSGNTRTGENTDDVERCIAILNNLNESSRKLFKLALESILASDGNGITQQELHDSARAQFILSSFSTLQSMCNEYFDHKILKVSTTHGDTEKIVSPLKEDQIMSVLSQLESDV